jgi:hypothetical protein
MDANPDFAGDCEETQVNPSETQTSKILIASSFVGSALRGCWTSLSQILLVWPLGNLVKSD